MLPCNRVAMRQGCNVTVFHWSIVGGSIRVIGMLITAEPTRLPFSSVDVREHKRVAGENYNVPLEHCSRIIRDLQLTGVAFVQRVTVECGFVRY